MLTLIVKEFNSYTFIELNVINIILNAHETLNICSSKIYMRPRPLIFLRLLALMTVIINRNSSETMGFGLSFLNSH